MFLKSSFFVTAASATAENSKTDLEVHSDDTDTEKNSPILMADEIDSENSENELISSKNSKKFERHKFPRDSGCFASSSSPASDRSSQPSQSESGFSGIESGIQLEHDDEFELIDNDILNHHQRLRNPEKSRETRNLRDRHTINANDLEKLSIVQNNKDNFDVLVEKYVTEKTPLQVEPGRVSSTRSIFESS